MTEIPQGNTTELDKSVLTDYQGFCTACMGTFMSGHLPVWVGGYPMHEGCAYEQKQKEKRR
jgi:hypothetical protein